MDQYRTEKAIEVMLAYVNGNSIEVRLNRPGCNWGPIETKCDETPAWDWSKYEYRVKPEPMRFYAVIPKDGDMPSCYPSFGVADEAWSLEFCDWHGWLEEVNKYRYGRLRELVYLAALEAVVCGFESRVAYQTRCWLNIDGQCVRLKSGITRLDTESQHQILN